MTLFERHHKLVVPDDGLDATKIDRRGIWVVERHALDDQARGVGAHGDLLAATEVDPGGQAPKAVTPRSSTAPINKTQFSRFTFSLLSIVPKPITFPKTSVRAKAWDHPLTAAWPEPAPA
jgi:hypothetical protein